MKKNILVMVLCFVMSLGMMGNIKVYAYQFDSSKEQTWDSYDYEAYCEKYGIEWERDSVSGKYSYPIDKQSEIWSELNHVDRIAVCNIPERVLEDINKEELKELVLNYPLLGDVYAYDTLEQGIKIVSSYFPPLEEVVEDLLTESNNALSEQSIETEVSYNEFAEMFVRHVKQYIVKKAERDTYAARAVSRYVYTPNGTAVTCLSYGETLTAADKTRIKNENLSECPGAIVLADPTTNYNCHSYAWYLQSTSNIVWMPSPTEYMTDGSYRYVGTYPTAAGQKVFYPATNHSAVVVNTSGTLRSKWGRGCLMQHSWENSPYYGTPGGVKVYTR